MKPIVAGRPVSALPRHRPEMAPTDALDHSPRAEIVVVAGDEHFLRPAAVKQPQPLVEQLGRVSAAANLGWNAVAEMAAVLAKIVVELVANRQPAHEVPAVFRDEESPGNTPVRKEGTPTVERLDTPDVGREVIPDFEVEEEREVLEREQLVSASGGGFVFET